MLMQLDSSLLGALRCFETAARLLSFTKAAHALNLTQSAVSQQIRHLEARLGYPLFVREPRKLKLTANGAVLFDTTAKALAEINRTLRQLAFERAPLQVNCLPSLALHWLMPRLTEFHRQQPDVSVRLQAEFQTLDRHAMDADQIDVAVRYDPGHYRHVQADVLMDEYLVAVATPEYLARHPRFAKGLAFDGAVLLHDASPWAGAAQFIEWRTWLEALRPDWLGHLDGPQFNLASLAVSAALNHQGVALGRSALIQDELESGRLIDVFGRHVRAPARYMLLSRRPDDERVAVFSTWIKAECERFERERALWLRV
ncbi:LysR family transcriptional regulator [Paraburkholderia sp. MMS20-SJTR3]|uniref:LysR family transcriptional regulator n=1 Tax=Paraburkholderia sejongensis TaxID=2886946 RepID=A0ABS8K410_9BURK|nr:LysR substrate-binding domain-containing protein [Paraburkholderia sp. MMS20-SJTR3]MCC8396901.1 LysR family transcriptional regulator [Paraburkholderia sp. MMS20-SJTR3]